jgi:hypothetical protein
MACALPPRFYDPGVSTGQFFFVIRHFPWALTFASRKSCASATTRCATAATSHPYASAPSSISSASTSTHHVFQSLVQL